MPAATYLKNKRKNIQSKYHQVAKRFESKYELIHRKLTSRFHGETSEIKLIRSKINNLTTQYIKSIENKLRPKRFLPAFLKTSNKIDNRFYPDFIDWYQGRFSGQTIRILVREGKIIEKVFLTPKGNKISVKRSHLLLRLGSLPSIQIKVRLRSILIEKIKRKSKLISVISV